MTRLFGAGALILLSSCYFGVAEAAPSSKVGTGHIDLPRPPEARTKPSGTKRIEPVQPIPSNLTSTTDFQVCSQHGSLVAGLLCKEYLPAGNLALVWDWNGPGTATGFRLWRVDGGRHELIDSNTSSAPGKYNTVFVTTTVPSDGFSGKCYAVSANWPSRESSLSQEYCASGGSTLQARVVQPKYWRSIAQVVTPGAAATVDSLQSFTELPVVGSANGVFARTALFF